jgi:hypothetical protein
MAAPPPPQWIEVALAEDDPNYIRFDEVVPMPILPRHVFSSSSSSAPPPSPQYELPNFSFLLDYRVFIPGGSTNTEAYVSVFHSLTDPNPTKMPFRGVPSCGLVGTSMLILADRSGNIFFTNINLSQPFKPQINFVATACCMALCPNERYLVTGWKNGASTLWDLKRSNPEGPFNYLTHVQNARAAACVSVLGSGTFAVVNAFFATVYNVLGEQVWQRVLHGPYASLTLLSDDKIVLTDFDLPRMSFEVSLMTLTAPFSSWEAAAPPLLLMSQVYHECRPGTSETVGHLVSNDGLLLAAPFANDQALLLLMPALTLRKQIPLPPDLPRPWCALGMTRTRALLCTSKGKQICVDLFREERQSLVYLCMACEKKQGPWRGLNVRDLLCVVRSLLMGTL